jgi:hypothetical protein
VIAGALVDTWIPVLGTALEFKYDRDIPSGRNTPHTQKAGTIFHDFFRLGRFSGAPHRVLVYISQATTSTFGAALVEVRNVLFLGNAERIIRVPDAFVSGKAIGVDVDHQRL